MKRKIVQIIPSDIKSKWDKTPQRSRVYDVSAGLVPSLCKELADFKILITGEPKTRRGRKMTEKSNCLMAQENTNFMRNEGNREIMLHGEKVKVLGIRRLTPTECARLQTIPTWYKCGLAATRRHTECSATDGRSRLSSTSSRNFRRNGSHNERLNG